MNGTTEIVWNRRSMDSQMVKKLDEWFLSREWSITAEVKWSGHTDYRGERHYVDRVSIFPEIEVDDKKVEREGMPDFEFIEEDKVMELIENELNNGNVTHTIWASSRVARIAARVVSGSGRLDWIVDEVGEKGIHIYAGASNTVGRPFGEKTEIKAQAEAAAKAYIPILNKVLSAQGLVIDTHSVRVTDYVQRWEWDKHSAEPEKWNLGPFNVDIIYGLIRTDFDKMKLYNAVKAVL